MKQAALSFLLLLSITASALQTNAMEPLIDAGSITHWQNSWSPRPIDLSTSNKGEVATLTFYARFTEAVPETGHLEITYPASFSSSGTSGKWDVELPSSGIDEDEEVTFEVTAALPDVIGAVGPFGIIARNYSNGQIVCMTNSFGSIYVKRDV